MVVHPAQPDEPVASSPGFIIEPGHRSDQRDADIDGIEGCSIPLYGEGEGCEPTPLRATKAFTIKVRR